MNLRKIAILVVSILALIILIQNTQIVTFTLLFWTASMSKIVLIIIAMVLGFVLGFLLRPVILKKKES